MYGWGLRSDIVATGEGYQHCVVGILFDAKCYKKVQNKMLGKEISDKGSPAFAIRRLREQHPVDGDGLLHVVAVGIGSGRDVGKVDIGKGRPQS